jgi:hypothetical protein
LRAGRFDSVAFNLLPPESRTIENDKSYTIGIVLTCMTHKPSTPFGAEAAEAAYQHLQTTHLLLHVFSSIGEPWECRCQTPYVSMRGVISVWATKVPFQEHFAGHAALLP